MLHALKAHASSVKKWLRLSCAVNRRKRTDAYTLAAAIASWLRFKSRAAFSQVCARSYGTRQTLRNGAAGWSRGRTESGAVSHRSSTQGPGPKRKRALISSTSSSGRCIRTRSPWTKSRNSRSERLLAYNSELRLWATYQTIMYTFPSARSAIGITSELQ
jgi:hypothetical protein